MKKILKRTYPYFIFVILAFLIWWSPDYFRPSTYFNIGDSLFPFKPVKQMLTYFYTWQENANQGLGGMSSYKSIMTLYYYMTMAFFKLIKIPLWISNRLFFAIPTLLLFVASYYMILSFLEEKYRYLSSFLASVFLATSPPLLFLDPLLHLAAAGMILSFAGLKRFIEQQRIHHLVLFSIGFLMTGSMPRYTYISIIFFAVFLFFYCIMHSRTKLKYNLTGILKLIIIGVPLVILLNFYTILPSLSFLFQHKSSDFLPNVDIFLHRINLLNAYKNRPLLLYSMRLINVLNGHSHKYFSNNSNVIISFAFLIFIFIPFIANTRSKKNKLLLSLLPTSLFILLWSILLGSRFYVYLIKYIPGLWTINNSQYILMALAIIYSIFLAFSVSILLEKIESNAFSIKKKKALNLLSVTGIAILIIVNNGSFFSDKIPIIPKLFNKKEIENNDLGNHCPYFKLPQGYKKIDAVLPEKDKAARILVLPFLWDGYMRYSWWGYKSMPEILAQITPLRLSGISFSPSYTIEEARRYFIIGQYDKAINILRKFGYKYIFFHKDMIASAYNFGKDLRFFAKHLPNIKYLEIVLDNKNFSLFKIKPLKKDKQMQIIYLNVGKEHKMNNIVIKKIADAAPEDVYISNRDGRFYTPRKIDCIIEAKIQKLPLSRKKIKSSAGFIFDQDELKNWNINSTKNIFNYYIEDEILVLSAYFEKDEKGDELVQMRNENIRVDLKEYPYFDLNYKIENPAIQTIEVVAGIDFNRDGKVDKYIPGIYPQPASSVWADFTYNLLNKVKAHFPGEEHYDLIFLELYPHKLWGADCSKPRNKGEYVFWIKGMSFYNFSSEQYIVDNDGIYVLPEEFILNKPIFNLDGKQYWLYKKFNDEKDAEKDIFYTKKAQLNKGEHYLENITDNSIQVEWIEIKHIYNEEQPEIEFNRINPTHYEVKVKDANKPFWLIFNESFDDQWKLYLDKKTVARDSLSTPQEGKSQSIFKPTFKDIKYLFKNSLGVEQYLVNGSFNGWYIDPEKMNLPENFSLILYFKSQSIFYIGFIVSLLTLICCFVFMGAYFIKKRCDKKE